MSLEIIQTLNPEYTIKSITDEAFRTYGKVIDNNIDEAIEFCIDFVQAAKQDNFYLPSVLEVEQLSSIIELSHRVYGYLEIIAGIVAGDNVELSGIEYHQGSETIIAVTDYILVVGHIWDMQYDTYNSSKCELFYVPKGTIVECYSATLHYTPIAVSKEGFITICLLLKGTGDILEKRKNILKKKNKWFIAHQDNLEKIASGDYPGLLGRKIIIDH